MIGPPAAPMDHALSDPDDRLLARSILGTDDADAILARVDVHCRAAMGAGVASVDRVVISIGAAFGLTLVDGRRVFLKAWSPATPMALLRDAHTVQSFLAARGYPCPAVLVGPRPFGAGHAALHAYRDEGEHADANAPSLRRAMAAALARLVALAAPCSGIWPGCHAGCRATASGALPTMPCSISRRPGQGPGGSSGSRKRAGRSSWRPTAPW